MDVRKLSWSWLLCVPMVIGCPPSMMPSGGANANGNENENQNTNDNADPIDDSPSLTLETGFAFVSGAGNTTGTTGEGFTCEGFFPEAPNAIMRLVDAFAGLSVQVASETGLILAIRFENSTFCSMVGEGVTDVTRGNWSAGDYEIYVGTVEQGVEAEYLLEIFESPE